MPYICTKRWIFTILWKTKSAVETISSNCLRLESIFARKLCVNMIVESTRSKYPYVYLRNIPMFHIPKFAEQYLVNLYFRAFRSGKNK